MTTYAGGLGKDFDIGVGTVPTSFSTAVTGSPISLQNCEGVVFVIAKSASGTTDDLAFDLQEVDGAAGTPRDLEIITDYWVKAETTLDNDEAWVKTTQSAASEVTAIAGTAEQQMLVAFAVRASDLSDGYTHVALNTPDLGSADTPFGAILYITYGLKVQRTPANMPNLKAPGVADA